MTLDSSYYDRLTERFSSSDLSLLSDHQLLMLHEFTMDKWGREVTSLRSRFDWESGQDGYVRLISTTTGDILWGAPREVSNYSEHQYRYAEAPTIGDKASHDYNLRPQAIHHRAAVQLKYKTTDRYPSSQSIEQEAERLLQEAQPELLPISPDFEQVRSGSNPPLPYPSARISTVSGTIILNTAMVNRLRDEHDGQIPQSVAVMLAEEGTRVGLAFHLKRKPGDYSLGMTTDQNRGYTIHCGQVIHKLRRAAEARLRGKREHGSDPQYQDPAANMVYGRRRLALTPGGVWTFSIHDERV